MSDRIVVGISGASGIVLAKRAIEVLTQYVDVDLVMTSSACLTARYELGKEYASPKRLIESFPEDVQKRISLHSIHDFSAPIASGSYLTKGMLIIPCSMSTIAALACGLSDNLLRRAADVTLKEKRSLVVVPRETPLHAIHLKNMLTLSEVGATIVPPVPAWYTHPKTVQDIEDCIVGRALDALHLHTNFFPRWNEVKECVSEKDIFYG
jgi:4-hydroxy-3-polyprenylbenzoate decarboxylase